MKKGTLINSELSWAIARLGHTDSLAIADAGLPIPDAVKRIDLALVPGVPSFMQVIKAVTAEMQVEAVTLAEEIKSHNAVLHQALLVHLHQLENEQGNTIRLDYVSHQQFKTFTQVCKAVVRSGECTPYANIILHSGVVF